MWQAGIALDHLGLHLDGAAHGVDNAAELDQRTVARAFYDAPVVHIDGRVHEIAAQRPESGQGAVFIGPGEPAEARHIRRGHGGHFG